MLYPSLINSIIEESSKNETNTLTASLSIYGLSGSYSFDDIDEISKLKPKDRYVTFVMIYHSCNIIHFIENLFSKIQNFNEKSL